jgi:hypothetical protein
MLLAIWAICFFECVRALRRFGVNALVSIHSIFVMTKTPLTRQGAIGRSRPSVGSIFSWSSGSEWN